MAEFNKKSSSGHQVRLIMWAVPRSTSTAVTKCLSFLKDSKVFFEPYIAAYHIGPDKVLTTISDAEIEDGMNILAENTTEVTGLTEGFEASQCTYKWVKEQLEAPHTGKKFIFCKDMAYSITGRKQFLPKGYRHLFLIRHPLKVFLSWKKVFQFAMKVPLDAYRLDELPPEMFPTGYGYKEMSDLIDYLKEANDQDVIIIDADDLLRDPRGTLSALFETTGLLFDEKILHWEEGEAISKTWVTSKLLLRANQKGQYYKGAFNSTCFTTPNGLPDRSSLTSDILHCVDASMPYYEKMYTRRLTAKLE